jgi:hypothetical protein
MLALVSLTLNRAPERSGAGGLEASFGLPFTFATSTLSVPPVEGNDATFNPWENPTTFDWARFVVAWVFFAVGVGIAWLTLTAFWRRVGSAAA